MSGRREEHRLSEAEFFDWLVTQERRHELVDGEIVMMAGAGARHDQVVVNVLTSLSIQLRGKMCRPYTADTAIRIPKGNIRFPDISVDCGAREPEAVVATEPRLVVEVLSPSTRNFDREDKLEEYKSVLSLTYIVLIDPELPDARLYRRDVDGTWVVEAIEGIADTITFPDLSVRLPMADIYEGITFSRRGVVRAIGRRTAP